MVRGEPPEAGSDLPAPYRSPWRSLAEALQAVAAAVLLKGRELWRRNHQSQLPLPRFWPRPLAALFWPLLLALAVLAVLLAVRLTALPARPPAGAAPGHQVPQTIGPRPAAPGIAAPSGPLRPPLGAPPASAGGVQDDAERGSAAQAPTGQGPAGQDGSAHGNAGQGNGPQASTAQSSTAQGSTAQSSAAQDGALQGSGNERRPAAGRAAAGPPARFSPALASTGATADPDTPPGAERSVAPRQPLQLDPLLALLSDREDRDLLQAVQPDPTAALLRLHLSERGDALSDQALLERAARWQQRALEAGYERLELVAAAGGLRARQALVGSGMILLAPAASPP